MLALRKKRSWTYLRNLLHFPPLIDVPNKAAHAVLAEVAFLFSPTFCFPLKVRQKSSGCDTAQAEFVSSMSFHMSESYLTCYHVAFV